jgi:hypothetical protein
MTHKRTREKKRRKCERRREEEKSENEKCIFELNKFRSVGQADRRDIHSAAANKS